MSTTNTVTKTAAAKRQQDARFEVAFPDINTIRKAIPAHCFVPSTWRSLSYLARDLLMTTTLVYLALTFIPQMSNVWMRTVAWMTYGFLQGLVGTGLWILGHECGHGAFSVHRTLNDTVGWFLHSTLFVPYFSWKYSHARHHLYTGHIEKDMTFVPATKEQWDERHLSKDVNGEGSHGGSWMTLGFDPEMFEDAPVVTVAKLMAHQLGGFMGYLMLNVSSGRGSLQRPEDKKWYRLSHFDPFSPVFRRKEAPFVFLSDVGLLLVLFGLYKASQVLDVGTVLLLWLVPYIWVHHWIVAITYLHHHHPDVNHYDNQGWTFTKGALGTIDRDFGFIDRHLFHGIIGTHVVHHLFAKIPFYHQVEATQAIKPVLGDRYHHDERSFHASLWSNFNDLKYVEEDPASPGTLRWNKKE